MHPSSPKPAYYNKLKTQMHNKNNLIPSSKKKNIHESKQKCSSIYDFHVDPETPRNLHKLTEEEEQIAHYLKTVSLTNTLIKAVENQKEILKNIKTISAEILKNRKTKKKSQKTV